MLVHFLLDSRRPHKKGRREASAQEARSQIPEQEDSALGNNTPKAPPASGGGAPSSVCENLYQSHGTQQPAQGFTSGLFHRHGSGRMVARQPRNHACGNARRWEKLYHQTLTNAFLKKNSSVIVNALNLSLKFLFLLFHHSDSDSGVPNA